MKDNIKPIENALDKLKQITGITYTNNDLAHQFGFTNKNEQVGVIAQDVEKVLPQVVKPAPFDTDFDTFSSKSGENYKTVQYEKLIPLLIEAIKEQQKKIEELESKIG